jgi:hypothetical protein
MALPSLRRLVTRRLGIEALRADHATMAAALEAHQAALDQHTLDTVAANERFDVLLQQLTQLSEQAAHLGAQLAAAERSTGTVQQVMWGTAWAAADPSFTGATVSVVLPTRNRAHLLPRAVQSVLGQESVQIELLVVDDGSTDDTAAVLAEVHDARITVLAGEGRGAAAARNLAVQRATGQFIAFADDDNIMVPGWLAAAVRHLQLHTDTDGVYGAQLREPEPGEQGDVTVLYRAPFHRDDMLLGPYIDLGVTVFRAGIAELSFDETLPALLDWDMLIRVTASHELTAIPVLASLYTTSAPHRISDRPDKPDAIQTVRDRASAERVN